MKNPTQSLRVFLSNPLRRECVGRGPAPVAVEPEGRRYPQTAHWPEWRLYRGGHRLVPITRRIFASDNSDRVYVDTAFDVCQPRDRGLDESGFQRRLACIQAATSAASLVALSGVGCAGADACVTEFATDCRAGPVPAPVCASAACPVEPVGATGFVLSSVSGDGALAGSVGSVSVELWPDVCPLAAGCADGGLSIPPDTHVFAPSSCPV